MKGIELAAGGLLTYLRANLNAESELINGENDDFDLVAVDEQAFRDYAVLPDKLPTSGVLGNRGGRPGKPPGPGAAAGGRRSPDRGRRICARRGPANPAEP